VLNLASLLTLKIMFHRESPWVWDLSSLPCLQVLVVDFFTTRASSKTLQELHATLPKSLQRCALSISNVMDLDGEEDVPWSLPDCPSLYALVTELELKGSVPTNLRKVWPCFISLVVLKLAHVVVSTVLSLDPKPPLLQTLTLNGCELDYILQVVQFPSLREFESNVWNLHMFSSLPALLRALKLSYGPASIPKPLRARWDEITVLQQLESLHLTNVSLPDEPWVMPRLRELALTFDFVVKPRPGRLPSSHVLSSLSVSHCVLSSHFMAWVSSDDLPQTLTRLELHDIHAYIGDSLCEVSVDELARLPLEELELSFVELRSELPCPWTDLSTRLQTLKCLRVTAPCKDMGHAHRKMIRRLFSNAVCEFRC
jgi:hypothetical protein